MPFTEATSPENWLVPKLSFQTPVRFNSCAGVGSEGVLGSARKVLMVENWIFRLEKLVMALMSASVLKRVPVGLIKNPRARPSKTALVMPTGKATDGVMAPAEMAPAWKPGAVRSFFHTPKVW